jgi:hypothetical protein
LQKLSKRNTCTPTNTSLVRSNCDYELNKDQSLSVHNLKTFDNNIEVNQRLTNNQSLQLKVFVLNFEGKPLMPTKCSRARKMLINGKAKVIKRIPFTIQLLKTTGETKQEINLGIDTGFGNIGFSAVSEKEELISGVLKLDPKTKDRLDEKRMYRKFKRSRHHWYRKPRFLNRKIKEGGLPPSIQRRYDTHINLINRIKKLLPISNIIIEVAKFDIQKLQNPGILGKEYQEGKLYQLDKISYLRNIQNNKCLFCNKEFKLGEAKSTHHKFQHGDFRRKDTADGLILLHKVCHERLHQNSQEKIFQNNKVVQYKQSTFMSIINKKFYKDIPDLKITFGNVTSLKREELGLEKSHTNDAFIISGGINQVRRKEFEIIQKHRNNRKLQTNRKGFKPSIRRKRYKIQPKDLVMIDNKWIGCNGCSNYGKQIIVNKKYISIKRIKRYFNFGSFIWKNLS